jgi:2-methylcitrate dehydratase PrpD
MLSEADKNTRKSFGQETLSQRLADVLAGTGYANLPAQVVIDAKRAVLDWLGSTLAGAIEPPARLVQGIAKGLGAAQEATVFAGGRSSAAGAALVNGVSSHILELDDVHKGSIVHPAAAIIPAALAVAEREHANGHAFLLAVALGYDAALRIGEAVSPSHYHYWHPTGTVATYGSAVAAGSLLKLSATQMVDALGNAGTQAAGLWEFNTDGTMSKHLHPGKAAFNGILSADLARAGFTGAARILEGERGFFQAMSTSFDCARITEGLGRTWKISENCYKLHSCCGHTHTAIDIALDLRSQRSWSSEDVLLNVAGIQIETYGPGYEIIKEPNPHSPFQAKFSIAYCVAAGLLEGQVGLKQFSPQRFTPDGITDYAIAELLQRTSVRVAEDLTQKFPSAWPARLVITLRDGSKFSGSSDYPRGNPENPVSTQQLEEKFLALVGSRFGGDTASAALQATHALEDCEDMSALFCNLSPM